MTFKPERYRLMRPRALQPSDPSNAQATRTGASLNNPPLDMAHCHRNLEPRQGGLRVYWAVFGFPGSFGEADREHWKTEPQD